MGTLQMFPEGCGYCGGSCCKHVTNGVPPWTKEELDHLDDILPHVQATIERAYNENRVRRPAGDAQCFRLAPNGACGLEDRGFPKPVACVELLVGGDACMEARKAEGLVV